MTQNDTQPIVISTARHVNPYNNPTRSQAPQRSGRFNSIDKATVVSGNEGFLGSKSRKGVTCDDMCDVELEEGTLR